MNIEFKEFIDEVKEEIMCYEELGQEYALKWEKEFYQWSEANLGKNKNIKELKGKFYFVISDESEIFEIADSYYDAIMDKNEKDYWKNF